MTGATVTISCDDALVQAALTRLAAVGGDLNRPMAEIAAYLLSSTRARFEAQQAPDGTPWVAISAAWAARKADRGWDPAILHQRGYLSGQRPGTLSCRSDASSAQVGTTMPYGAVHQFGGDIEHEENTFQRTLHFRTGSDEYGNKIVKNGFVKRKKSNFSQDVTVTIRAFTQRVLARPWLGLSSDDNFSIASILADSLRRVTEESPDVS